MPWRRRGSPPSTGQTGSTGARGTGGSLHDRDARRYRSGAGPDALGVGGPVRPRRDRRCRGRTGTSSFGTCMRRRPNGRSPGWTSWRARRPARGGGVVGVARRTRLAAAAGARSGRSSSPTSGSTWCRAPSRRSRPTARCASSSRPAPPVRALNRAELRLRTPRTESLGLPLSGADLAWCQRFWPSVLGPEAAGRPGGGRPAAGRRVVRPARPAARQARWPSPSTTGTPPRPTSGGDARRIPGGPSRRPGPGRELRPDRARRRRLAAPDATAASARGGRRRDGAGPRACVP